MPYTGKFEDRIIEGTHVNRPWYQIDIIKKYIKSDDILLDNGCGTAIKIIKVANDVKMIYGLEPNPSMRTKAEENIKEYSIKNMILINGYSYNIPFPSEKFDIVTSMLAPYDVHEIWRVLKPGGYAILETIGDRDKWNLKPLFGKDDIGPRGQNAHFKKEEKYKMLEKQFSAFFSETNIRNGSWPVFYTIEGLILLLEQTPTIRGFDKEKDAGILEKIKTEFMTEQEIETNENRILVIAKK